MRIKRVFFQLIVSLLLMVIIGCGGGGSGSSKNNSSSFEGVVQKGNFVSGTVSLKLLDKNGISSTIQSSTIKDGIYSLNKPNKDKNYILEARGFFKDELINRVSSDSITLFALYKDTKRVNINLFSTLEAQRVVELLKEGKSYKNALAIAKSDIAKIFTIPNSIDVSDLDIFKLNSSNAEYNYKLLLFSLSFLDSYHKANSKSLRVVEQNIAFISLNQFMKDMLHDFAKDGELNNEFKDRFTVIAPILNNKKKQQELLRNIKDIQTIPGIDNFIQLNDETDPNNTADDTNSNTDESNNTSDETNSSTDESNNTLNNKENNDTIKIADISIKEIRLNSVTVDGVDIDYINEHLLYIGMDSRNKPTINLYLKYIKRSDVSEDIKVYLKYGSNKKLLNITVKNSYFIKDDEREKYISIIVDTTFLNILQSIYDSDSNISLEVNVGTYKKEITNLPKFVRNFNKMVPNITISKLQYKGKCSTPLNSNNYILADIEGSINDTKVTFSNGCFKLNFNRAKTLYELTIENAKGILQDSIKLSTKNGIKNDIIVDEINKNGIKLKKIIIELPKNHSVHKRDLNVSKNTIFNFTTINPYGSSKVEINTNSIAQNLSDFNFTVTLNKPIYLHANNLPFYLESNRIYVSNKEIKFFNTSAFYAYDFQNGDAKNNANRFSNPASSSFDVVLSKDGFSSASNIGFLAVNNFTSSYPEANISSSSFSLKLTNSQMVDITTLNDSAFSLNYYASCLEDGCSNQSLRKTITLSNINQTRVFSDGAVISFNSGTLPKISWGLNSGGEVFKREEDQDAYIYIPGFEIAANSEDTFLNTLFGSAKKDGNSISYFALNSDEAKAGSYLFAGVNVGKVRIDIDDNTNEAGTSLNNKPMVILFENNKTVTINSNNHSKYVIKNDGVTGVFNKAGGAFDTQIYGYNTHFERFSFRQIANKIDSFTWIDGKFHIPNKGNFDLYFNSLTLACNGSFSSANVPSCDMNTNRNCNQTLAVWKAKTEFKSLDFNGQNGVCDANKRLRISHIIDLLALNYKLLVQTTWTPTGLAVDTKLKSSAINQLDGLASKRGQKDNEGYDIKIENIKLASNSAKDWFDLNATVGVPFWNAIEASIIAKNSSPTTRDYTIIVQNGDLNKIDLTQSNLDIYNDIKEDYNLTVNYNWANIIPFNLPVYYQSSKEENKVPSFIGRKKNVFDLKVISLDTAVSYINPKQTTIKFGASADFVEMEKLKFDIDLTTPDGFKKVDNFLVDGIHLFQRNINNEGPLEATFGRFLTGVYFSMYLLISNTFDITLALTTAKGIDEAFKSLGDNNPLRQVAKSLNLNHSLPPLVNDRFEQVLKRDILDVLNSSLNEIDLLFQQATPGMYYSSFAKQNDQDLQAILKKLELIDNGIKEYEKLFSFIKNLKKSVDDGTNVINVASNLYHEYITFLKPMENNTTCNWKYTSHHGAFKPVGEIQDKIIEVNNAVKALDEKQIEFIANKIGSFTGVDFTGLVDITRKIKKLSLKMDELVSYSNGYISKKFEEYICKSKDIENLLKEIKVRITEIDTLKRKNLKKLDELFLLLKEDGDVGMYIYTIKEFKDILSAKLNSLYTYNAPIPQDALTKFAQGVMNFDDNSNLLGLKGIDIFKVVIINQTKKLIEDKIFKTINKMEKDLNNILPNMAEEEISKYILNKFLMSAPIRKLSHELEVITKPIGEKYQEMSMMMISYMGRAINYTLGNASRKINEILNKAVANFKDVPFKSAKVDGFAIIRGNTLYQLHIGAEFKAKENNDTKKNKDSVFSFEAALDIWQNGIKSSGGCAGSDFNSSFNAQISARDISMDLGDKKLKVDLILFGVTLLDSGLPVGVFGAITSKSGFDFKKFKLYNLGLTFGAGKFETYLGAKAKAKVDAILLGANFLVGRLCNVEIQKNFIPKTAYEFMTIPNNLFSGAFVYGEAQIPAWNNGCMLTLSVRAKVGTWLLIDPGKPVILGGLFGGALFGQGVCIATLGGELLLLAEYSDGNVRFEGNGWGAAGLGSCDESWDSVATSRKDDWCGTGDAQFSARFDKGVSLRKIEFSAIH